MREVVINCCYGGFGLSNLAIQGYLKRKGITTYPEVDQWDNTTYWLNKEKTEAFWYDDVDRHDLDLVTVVKALGKLANDRCANLQIVEVCGRYRINEYDGMESLEEEGGYSGWL